MLLFGYLEGWIPHEHFVCKHSDCPEIYFLVVGVSDQNFRREIKRSSAKSASQLVFYVNCPSKITEFNSSQSKDNIFGLNITVKNVHWVHVVDSLKQTFCYEASGLFAEFSFFHEFVKLAIGTKFHDHIDEFLVIAHTIELDEVRMV